MLSDVISNVLVLLLVGGIPAYAYWRRVDVFAEFVDGARDGVSMAVKIVPYLVAFLVAIGMFRAAGGFALLAHVLGPLLHRVGFPVELLPMALIRPFSGGAANAMLADIAQQHGGHSFLAHAAAIIMGSTETTLYVVMVYFASVGVSRTRHAIPVGLFADAVGVIAAVCVARCFF